MPQRPIKAKRKPVSKRQDWDDDEVEDYEDEYEDEAPARSRGRRPSTGRHGGRVSKPWGGFPWLLAAAFLGAFLFGYLWTRSIQSGSENVSGGYRVTGVSQGKVWAVDPQGKPVYFSDAQLVRSALSGKIKAGDVIQP